MKKRPVNLLLILGVILLSALPLWLVQKPEDRKSVV